MQREKDSFQANATVFVLENREWQERGNGLVEFLFDSHTYSLLLISSPGTIHEFICKLKPRIRSKGPRAYVLRADLTSNILLSSSLSPSQLFYQSNHSNNEKFILAVRFDKERDSQLFRNFVDRIATNIHRREKSSKAINIGGTSTTNINVKINKDHNHDNNTIQEYHNGNYSKTHMTTMMMMNNSTIGGGNGGNDDITTTRIIMEEKNNTTSLLSTHPTLQKKSSDHNNNNNNNNNNKPIKTIPSMSRFDRHHNNINMQDVIISDNHNPHNNNKLNTKRSSHLFYWSCSQCHHMNNTSVQICDKCDTKRLPNVNVNVNVFNGHNRNSSPDTVEYQPQLNKTTGNNIKNINNHNNNNNDNNPDNIPLRMNLNTPSHMGQPVSTVASHYDPATTPSYRIRHIRDYSHSRSYSHSQLTPNHINLHNPGIVNTNNNNNNNNNNNHNPNHNNHSNINPTSTTIISNISPLVASTPTTANTTQGSNTKSGMELTTAPTILKLTQTNLDMYSKCIAKKRPEVQELLWEQINYWFTKSYTSFQTQQRNPI